MPKNKATTPAYTPTVWVKTVDGVERERTALNISEEVAYRFNGWLPKDKKSAASAEKNAAAAAKPAK